MGVGVRARGMHLAVGVDAVARRNSDEAEAQRRVARSQRRPACGEKPLHGKAVGRRHAISQKADVRSGRQGRAGHGGRSRGGGGS